MPYVHWFNIFRRNNQFSQVSSPFFFFFTLHCQGDELSNSLDCGYYFFSWKMLDLLKICFNDSFCHHHFIKVACTRNVVTSYCKVSETPTNQEGTEKWDAVSTFEFLYIF